MKYLDPSVKMCIISKMYLKSMKSKSTHCVSVSVLLYLMFLD